MKKKDLVAFPEPRKSSTSSKLDNLNNTQGMSRLEQLRAGVGKQNSLGEAGEIQSPKTKKKVMF